MKIDYQKIKKTRWYRQEITSCFYFALAPSWGCLEALKGGQNAFWYVKENNTRAYLSEQYFLKLAKKYFKRYRKNRQSLKKIYQKWLNWNKNFEKLINKVIKLKVSKLADSQLIALNQQVGYKAYKFWTLEFFMDIYDTNTEQFIARELNQSKITIKPEEINILLKPNQLSTNQAYHRNILELYLTIKKQGEFKKFLSFNQLSKTAQEEVNQIINKYYFINNSFTQAKELTNEIILGDLRHLKGDNSALRRQSSNLRNYQAYITGQKQKIFVKYGFSKWLKDVFKFFAIIGLWRDQRKVMLQKTITALDKLGKEIAQRSKLPWSEVSCCVPYTIKKISVPQSLIQHQRKFANSHYLNIWENKQKKVVFLPKKTCDKLMRYFEPANQKIKEFTGQVACQGYVKGVVKIIMGEKDFSKFKKGDILVTVMTRPEFVPLIKMAKAIITDEGGVTCHAAIISRELNKPCIIGTRFTTRVLKSGDGVEVDANKGIVKKINNY